VVGETQEKLGKNHLRLSPNIFVIVPANVPFVGHVKQNHMSLFPEVSEFLFPKSLITSIDAQDVRLASSQSHTIAQQLLSKNRFFYPHNSRIAENIRIYNSYNFSPLPSLFCSAVGPVLSERGSE
jgi:hypothetical protein